MASVRDQKWVHPVSGASIGYRNPAGVYVIYRSIGGRTDRKIFERSTGQADVFLAFEEYTRFLANPADYQSPKRTVEAAGQQGTPPVYLTPELIEERIAHGEASGELTSADWIRSLRAHLKWWLVALHGVNLRRLPKGLVPRPAPSPEGCDLGLHILAPLQAKDAAGKRLVAAGTEVKRVSSIKSLYAYLREGVFRIEPEEDPTLNRLRNKKAEKEQEFGRIEKVNSIEDTWKVIDYWENTEPAVNQHSAAAAPRLGPDGRLNGHQWKADILILLVNTPWHFSEVARFCDPAEAKSRLVLPGDAFWKEIWRDQDPDTVAVSATRAKAKKQIARFKLDKRACEAALRLRERGKIGDATHFRDELYAACAAVGVGRLYPGRYRHTYLTNATDHGADSTDVIDAANHASQATSAIYTEGAVPAKKRSRTAEAVSVLDVPKRLPSAPRASPTGRTRPALRAPG